MSNLFRKYVDSRPVRTPLDFGHNENVIITKVDINDRKNGETVINANTYITLNKVDDSGKVIGTYEGSFWNLDPTQQNSDIPRNITDQFSIMAGIISAVGGDLAQFDADVHAIEDRPEDMDLATYADSKKKAREVQDSFQKAFMTQIEDKIGSNCPKLKCKLTSNKKGYLNFSREINWIVSMDEADKIAEVTDTEKAVYAEAMEEGTKKKQAEPDKTDAKPDGEKKTTKKTAFAGI